MIPGKQYTPEVLLQIAWRRKWLIVIPAAVIAAVVAAVVHRLPDLFEAEATILVVPQRVPEDYVRPAVSTSVEDRLTLISHQILTRTRLARIVEDFNLYPDRRRRELIEDTVNRMRQSDINIEGVQGDEFRVGFRSSDPRTAMQVTERLASLFIDENLRDREVLVEGTSQFLESQVKETRRQLIDNERKLEAYRRQHKGDLPSDVEANVQAIHDLEMQALALTDSINHDRDRRLVLERSLADANAIEASAPPQASNDDVKSAGTTAADALRAAEATLREMELRLTPKHPDIGIMKRQIAELQKRADAEAAHVPVSDLQDSGQALRRNRLAETKAEIENLDKSLASKADEERRLRADLAEYQRRIEAAPTRQTELTDLSRDYETYQSMYQDLLAKWEQAKVTANLERRQKGEQFRILDPPQLPKRPSSPDRNRLNLIGLAAALAVGFGLAALVEYLDRSVRSEDDVKAALNVTVLATVPLIHSVELARRRRRLLAASISIGAAAAVSAAAAAWQLLR